jgi:hypothetical protein
MKIINETELMKNQRGSTVVVPDQQFEALQTVEGNSLVFSIGLDNILYVTREVPGDTHGWVKVDLSSYLSATYYSGQTVEAKTFDIAQDLNSTNTVDIALSVLVNGQYYLHIATGFVNTLDNWAANTPQFTQYLFDYPGTADQSFKGMPINDVQILDSNDGNATQYIIVDLITNLTSNTISRFYIDWTKGAHGYAWLPHDLPIDLQAGEVTSLLGCGPNDGPNDNDTGGVYVMGTVNNVTQLIYTPSYNFYHPEEETESTVFAIPANTDSKYSAIALSAPALKAPYTDLFFASNGTLYFIACEDQIATETQKPVPAAIYTHDLFKNIQSIHVRNWNNNIVLWGESLSTDGTGTSQLFIMECLAGQETNADAWSCPIPLLFNVENSATYVNNTYSTDSAINADNGNTYGSCSVLFAHQADGSLVQLFQDPITTAWQERRLLVEPNSYTEMFETISYTTHINITDDNNLPQTNLPVSLWASSPCSVYVNNKYCLLDNVNPLNATTDGTGVVNIMQAVDTIGGISYYLSVKDPVTGEEFDESINPVTGTMSKMSGIQKGTDLSSINVYDENNKKTTLIDPSAPADQTDAVAQNINVIYQQKDKLPANGGVAGQTIGGKPVAAPAPVSPAESAGPVAPAVQAPTGAAAQPQATHRPKSHLAKHIRFDPSKHSIHAITFGAAPKFHNGIDEVKQLGITLSADGSLNMPGEVPGIGSFLSSIEAKAGHIYKWLKTEASKLENLVQKIITVTADGLIHCLVQIADATYHFLVQCANDIANAVHTVLNAIKTAFEDMVKWLGSLFNWPDILRTHSVMKSFFLNYLNNTLDNIDGTRYQLNYAMDEAIQAIDSFAGITDDNFPSDTSSSQTGTTDQSKGQNSPSANHGHQQVKNNSDNSGFGSIENEIGELLDDFFSAMEMEYVIIANAVDQIQEIISEIKDTPLIDVIKKILAVIADAMIESGVNLCDTLLAVARDLIGDIVNNALNKPIEIPVLSTLYKTFAGSELTLLDLACLLTAIPLNVVYKLSNGQQAPFPDSQATTDLINATSFAEFIAAMPAAAPVKTPAAATPQGLQATSLGDTNNGYQVWTDDQTAYWTGVGNICAFFGSAGIIVTSIWKAENPYSKKAAYAYAVFYLPYIAPDIIALVQYSHQPNKYWYNYFNAAIASVCTVKSLVDAILTPSAPLSADPAAITAPVVPPALGAPDDEEILPAPDENPNPVVQLPATGSSSPSKWKKPFSDTSSKTKIWQDASPLIEGVLNLIWEVPTVFSYLAAEDANSSQSDPDKKKKAHDVNAMALAANTCFNAGGIITPFGVFAPDPAAQVVLGVQSAMNAIYGILTLATNFV